MIDNKGYELAKKYAGDWLKTNIPDYEKLPHGEFSVEALANHMMFFVVELGGGFEVTTKFDTLLTVMKQKRDQMAKMRDEMREVLAELESEYDNFHEGIEDIDIGIESLEAGIDQISEIV